MVEVDLGRVLALSCAVSWALAVMLLRRCGESLPAFELNLFKNGLGLALVVLSIPVVQDLAIPEYSLVDLMVSLLSGFLSIAVADT